MGLVIDKNSELPSYLIFKRRFMTPVAAIKPTTSSSSPLTDFATVSTSVNYFRYCLLSLSCSRCASVCLLIIETTRSLIMNHSQVNLATVLPRMLQHSSDHSTKSIAQLSNRPKGPLVSLTLHSNWHK